MHISSNPHRNECAIKFSQLKKNVPPSLKSYNNFIYRVYKERGRFYMYVYQHHGRSRYIYICTLIGLHIMIRPGPPPPPLEIEKQKKKRSSDQLLDYFIYICYFLSQKYHFLSYFLSWAPPLKNFGFSPER